jgi:hypothetical protein
MSSTRGPAHAAAPGGTHGTRSANVLPAPGALRTDTGAAVRARNRVDDAQAQTHAGRLTRQARVHAMEAAEDPPLLPARDPDAVVRDFEPDVIGAVGLRPDDDALVGRGVFQGVVDQVHEGAAQRIGIGDERRQIGSHVHLERSGIGHASADAVDRGANHRGGIDRAERQADRASIRARKGQEVLDHSAQAGVLGGNELQVLARLDRVGVRIGQQTVNEHRGGGERRAQLVRGRGHEIGLQPREAQRTADGGAHADAGQHDQHDAGQRRGNVDRAPRAASAARASPSSGTYVNCHPGSHGPAAIASPSAASPGGIAMNATPPVST